ncbi:hypothetical protein FGO68_gene4579 [Halteria grandinella]|uniref:Ion transport domain-containing protein n=1 Tax=Halteria grandinella TaxID=5974 RepID=A0A8J8P6T2_HALGN|nr:hypothetical protein FGO68_gene4579 [Halteria grandinella]
MLKSLKVHSIGSYSKVCLPTTHILDEPEVIYYKENGQFSFLDPSSRLLHVVRFSRNELTDSNYPVQEESAILDIQSIDETSVEWVTQEGIKKCTLTGAAKGEQKSQQFEYFASKQFARSNQKELKFIGLSRDRSSLIEVEYINSEWIEKTLYNFSSRKIFKFNQIPIRDSGDCLSIILYMDGCFEIYVCQTCVFSTVTEKLQLQFPLSQKLASIQGLKLKDFCALPNEIYIMSLNDGQYSISINKKHLSGEAERPILNKVAHMKSSIVQMHEGIKEMYGEVVMYYGEDLRVFASLTFMKEVTLTVDVLASKEGRDSLIDVLRFGEFEKIESLHVINEIRQSNPSQLRYSSRLGVITQNNNTNSYSLHILPNVEYQQQIFQGKVIAALDSGFSQSGNVINHFFTKNLDGQPCTPVSISSDFKIQQEHERENYIKEKYQTESVIVPNYTQEHQNSSIAMLNIDFDKKKLQAFDILNQNELFSINFNDQLYGSEVIQFIVRGNRGNQQKFVVFTLERQQIRCFIVDSQSATADSSFSLEGSLMSLAFCEPNSLYGNSASQVIYCYNLESIFSGKGHGIVILSEQEGQIVRMKCHMTLKRIVYLTENETAIKICPFAHTRIVHQLGQKQENLRRLQLQDREIAKYKDFEALNLPQPFSDLTEWNYKLLKGENQKDSHSKTYKLIKIECDRTQTEQLTIESHFDILFLSRDREKVLMVDQSQAMKYFSLFSLVSFNGIMKLIQSNAQLSFQDPLYREFEEDDYGDVLLSPNFNYLLSRTKDKFSFTINSVLDNSIVGQFEINPSKHHSFFWLTDYMLIHQDRDRKEYQTFEIIGQTQTLHMHALKFNILPQTYPLDTYKDREPDDHLLNNSWILQELPKRLSTNQRSIEVQQAIIQSSKEELTNYTYYDWILLQALIIDKKGEMLGKIENHQLKSLFKSSFPTKQHRNFSPLHVLFSQDKQNSEVILSSILQEFSKEKNDSILPYQRSIVWGDSTDIAFNIKDIGQSPIELLLHRKQFGLCKVLLKYLESHPANFHTSELSEAIPSIMQEERLHDALKDYLDSRLNCIMSKEQLTPSFQEKFQQNEGLILKVSLNKDSDEKVLVPEKEQDVNELCEVKNIDIVLSINQLKQFLATISSSKNCQSLLSSSTIQLIVDHLWQNLRKTLLIELFLPYVVLLCTFIAYSNVYNGQIDTQDNLEASHGELALAIIVIVLSSYFILIEFKQLRNGGTDYIVKNGLWNLLDIVPSVLCITVVSIKTFQKESEPANFINTIHSIASLSLWVRFLYFLRIFDSTSYYIQIITGSFWDMKEFIAILFIVQVGFGEAFLRLSERSDGEGIFLRNFADAFVFAFRMGLGDNNTDSFEEISQPITAWILFILCSLFTGIVMLNILISVIGQSFERINSQSEFATYKERIDLMHEHGIQEGNMWCFRSSIQNDEKFKLMVISPIQPEDNEQNTLEGEIKQMREEFGKQLTEVKNTQEQTKKRTDEIYSMLKQLQEKI